MNSLNTTDLAREQLAVALTANSGRSAHTIHGGHDHKLRQTVVAMAAGRLLDEHESPAEATLMVLVGRLRLVAGDESWEGAAGDYLVIPPARHRVEALDDAVLLLTVVTGSAA